MRAHQHRQPDNSPSKVGVGQRLDYFFNTWPCIIMKMCPIDKMRESREHCFQNIGQSNEEFVRDVNIFPNGGFGAQSFETSRSGLATSLHFYFNFECEYVNVELCGVARDSQEHFLRKISSHRFGKNWNTLKVIFWNWTALHRKNGKLFSYKVTFHWCFFDCILNTISVSLLR